MSRLHLPTSTKQLRACTSCRIVLNAEQFRHECPNCHSSSQTEHFKGVVSITDPSKSWLFKWFRLGEAQSFQPGVYAMELSTDDQAGFDDYAEEES